MVDTILVHYTRRKYLHDIVLPVRNLALSSPVIKLLATGDKSSPAIKLLLLEINQLHVKKDIEDGDIMQDSRSFKVTHEERRHSKIPYNS
jgi:hypothetical protein